MSIEARTDLCDRLFFQAASQRSDLLDPNATQTQLIAFLLDMVNAGFFLEVTAVRSDHHDDSALGLHCHAHGYCADVWPLNTPKAGDYMDATSVHFQDFLEVAAASPWRYQIGLAGSAQTAENRAAAGSSCFDDDGADHIHVGANGP